MSWSEKYVSVAGAGAHDGSSEANAWTFAEALAAYSTGQRINVKAGTYAFGAGDALFGTAGTTTAPIWWRGYNTTIGDIDSNNALTKPVATFTGGGRWKGDSAYHIFSNFDISGDQTTYSLVRLTTDHCRMVRCRIECTGAASDGRALLTQGADCVFLDCWLKCTSSANVCDLQGASNIFIGCSFEGGNRCLNVNASTVVAYACSFNDVGGDAVNSVSGASDRVFILGCTFYSAGSDAVEFAASPAVGVVVNCVIDSSSAYGINNSSGGNLANIFRAYNLFHGSGTANENAMGDTPSFFEQTDSSSPFTNAGGGDLSLLSTSNAKANGPPGGFENQSYTSYMDIGAVQRQEPAGGGGGMLVHPGMTGGAHG